MKSNSDLILDSAAMTIRGQVRPINEDAVFHRTTRTELGQDVGLYLVCDGLGGHAAGDVASDLTVKTITSELGRYFPWLGAAIEASHRTQPTADTLQHWIEYTIEKANTATRQYAAEHPQEAARLGTTLALAIIYQGVAHIANIGDSRVYGWRNGELNQITRDHSVVGTLYRKGIIDQEEAIDHPRRNVISRAIGISEAVEADFFEWDLEAGDRLLLCTDGLWAAFPDFENLTARVGGAASPQVLCEDLVAVANQRDGTDNISAVVIFIS